MSSFTLAARACAVSLTLGSAFGACGGVALQPGGAAGSAGAVDGSAGAGGGGGVVTAGHDGGAVTSPGTVTLRFVAPASRSFCDEVCAGITHITILDDAGHPVPTEAPFCEAMCAATCQPVGCPLGGACLPLGLSFASGELAWDGSTYPTSTCGAGVPCYRPTFVPPGRYVAHMCATPGKLASPMGAAPVCTATGAMECVDVPFDLPGKSVVEGTLSGAPDGGVEVVPCTHPQPVLVGDGNQSSPQDTGFDRCEDGALRRRVAVTCPLGPSGATSPCSATDDHCASDADCTAGPHGICANSHKLLGYCGCFYGCMKDADCSPGSICFCGDPAGTCVPATCTGASSCPAGSACASSSSGCPGGMAAFACQKAADDCLGDADCGEGARCVQAADRRVCTPACFLPPAKP